MDPQSSHHRGERTALARIIDASANRGAEALRVLDDIARFTLDDAVLCSVFKEMRHELRAVIALLPIDSGALLASRDTPGDVGTDIFAPAELRREGIPAIARAACGRLTESLRSIEEAAKGFAATAAAERAEQLRYRAYQAERKIVLALSTGRARQWRLCVLISESLCRFHAWERVAELAIAGGTDCMQLREKSIEEGELARRAARLVAIARSHARGPERPAIIVNDRVDIALLSGADGVHVGQTDLSVADVRKLAGFSLLVGVSTTSIEQARQAASDGADYCGVGPMFPSGTKPKPTLAGVEYLRAYLAQPQTARLPHLAISGIDASNAGELAAAGCRGVAVSSAVCGAERPDEAVREILGGLALGGPVLRTGPSKLPN